MPSPRATSKDSSGKRPGASSSVSSRSGAAKSTASAKAAAPAPAPAAPAAPVEKPATVSLINDGPKAAPAKTMRPALKPLPSIGGKKAPPVTTAPAVVEPVQAAPAPTAPVREVVDLISSPSIRASSVAAKPAPEPEPVAVEIAPPAGTIPASAPVTPQTAVEINAETGEKTIHLKPPVMVKDLALAMGLKPFVIIKNLMEIHIFANQATVLETHDVTTICKKLGYTFEAERRERGAGVHKQEVVVQAPPPPVIVNPQEELKVRAPIITFMGHVDHGKTSLMDAIRKTRVAKGEAGGITQHIGAYSVDYQGHKITFLDTPGHAAFTAMRARGASITDIVVIVIAADDGIMPQTQEAINHAKAAKVNIMVAINKIDLPGANIDRVKKQLQDQGLTPDDWGGDIPVCPVSATKGTGIDHLLELVTLQAELLDLKASPTAAPRGTVIEAQIEAGRGPTATVIVRMGTLKTGDSFICGAFSGKVKALFDDVGKPIKSAGPSTPVKVVGFSGLPSAGDEFLVMNNEKQAKELSEQRILAARTKKLVAPQRAKLEDFFGAGDNRKNLRLILKTDVQGSLEAIVTSLQQIDTKKVELEFVHTGVGPITDNDVLLASASNAIVVGFNTKVENVAVSSAKREGIQVKLYSIIYELLDQMKEAMAGLLDPELRETVIGHAEVKKVFALSKGTVAGCIVLDGKVTRTARARLLRRRQPVYDGGMSTLRRFTDDVKEVRAGVECGIKLGDYSDYQPEDVIECYTLEKIAQKL